METEIEEMSIDERTYLTEDVEITLTKTKGMDCDEHKCFIKDMKTTLGRAKQPKLENCCIYKVPHKIRETNPVAYTPKVISIGPLHHGDKGLKPMEELKLIYLKSYLVRTEMKLEDCIEKLREKEEHIRSCYADIPHVVSQKSDEFVKMILTDASFIIEYFFRFIEKDKSDPLISNPVRRLDIRLDLILLENQLPFFVLEELFTYINDRRYSTFLEVSFLYLFVSYHHYSTFDQFENIESKFRYFGKLHLRRPGPTGKREENEVQHLTDILRFFFLPSYEQRPKMEDLSSPKYSVSLRYSASQLREAGLKFKIGKEKSLIQLQFKNGVLKMPLLLVEYDTETLLRNMAALEQCHYPSETYIAEYVVLLDFLINDRKDVDILVDKGVVVNVLGDSNKVVSIFNDICMGMEFSTYSVDYLKLCTSLNRFYKKSLHKYQAIFIRDYCSTPWKIASFLAAIVLLLLTLTQTICSILSLSKGK